MRELRREFNGLRRAPGYFTLIGDKAPPAAHDSSEVAHAYNLRCHPYTRNSGLVWRLGKVFFIQDESMGVSRFAPQGAQHHVDVINLLT